jgi:hypothetical protein
MLRRSLNRDSGIRHGPSTAVGGDGADERMAWGSSRAFTALSGIWNARRTWVTECHRGVEPRKGAVDADEPDADARIASDASPQDRLGYTGT